MAIRQTEAHPPGVTLERQALIRELPNGVTTTRTTDDLDEVDVATFDLDGEPVVLEHHARSAVGWVVWARSEQVADDAIKEWGGAVVNWRRSWGPNAYSEG